jgi:hypothetical protein
MQTSDQERRRTLVRNARSSHLQPGAAVRVPIASAIPKMTLEPSVASIAAQKGTYCAINAYTRRRKLTRFKYPRDT